MKCPICFKRATNYTTECKHLFCIGCLRKWKKTTCPICRQAITLPSYPNTRSRIIAHQVYSQAKRLLDAVENMKSLINKRKHIITLLQYIWYHRIIFRQDLAFVRIIRRRSKVLHAEFVKLKMNPPKILKQFYTF